MRGRSASLAVALAAVSAPALVPPTLAQVVTWTDVSPSSAMLDAGSPSGATGGRTNGLATVPGDNQTLYAATEWGGLYKTIDGGRTWARLDGHLPSATWDVQVDPFNANRVVATSFFDGRTTSISGINVSNDGGASWTHPATANPPAGFCRVAEDRTERAAFGIAFDPDAPATLYVGTSCGLAASDDSGATWRFVDPTPGEASATRIWDVIVHDGGTIDVCGDDGHLRSTDGGATWTAGSGLPSGMCSLAASPDESYVLLATAGSRIYESDDANSATGATWTELATNPAPPGRIPFVVTNQRPDDGEADVFDLWFGDANLHRATCTTPAVPAPGGSPRCPTASATWSRPHTRTAGARDDMVDLAFDSEASHDACPVAMSSGAGVYRNSLTTSPACHSPAWEAPEAGPHALWVNAMRGTDQSGIWPEELYVGTRDSGGFFSAEAGAPSPTWAKRDGAVDAVATIGCTVGSGRCPWSDGAEARSAGLCGVAGGVDASKVPTLYAQAGACDGVRMTEQLWKLRGTNPAAAWTRLTLPSGGVGVFAVDPKDPEVLIASGLTASGFAMYSSRDGGVSWSSMPQLDSLMTGAGAFVARSTRGPSGLIGFDGYWQPSLVAFDPVGDNVVAGGTESGVFLSTDGGATWALVSDPLDSDISGVPHLPRPRFAYFDVEMGEDTNVYIGTQGRGVWRMTVATDPVFTIDDVTVMEGDVGTVTATFTVTAQPVPDVPTSLGWETEYNFSALPGVDYVETIGIVDFEIGQASQTLEVPVLGDTLLEADETFLVNLFSPMGTGVVIDVGFGTIQDDETPPTLAVGDVQLAEGNSGTTDFVLPVTLSFATEVSVSADFATVDGTATSALASASGPGVTIAGGVPSPYPSQITVSGVVDTVTKVTVEIADFGHTWPQDVDVLLVGPGGQSVVLMSDVGGQAPGLTGAYIIFDDGGASLPPAPFANGAYRPTNLDDGDGDDAYPAPAPTGPPGTMLSVFNGVDPNGTWSLYVYDDIPSADDGSLASWTVNIRTDAVDYMATSGRVIVPPGSTSGTITVSVLGDTQIEPDETFDVVLSNPAFGTILDGTGTATILDDDDPSAIFSDGFESGNTSAWSTVVP